MDTSMIDAKEIAEIERRLNETGLSFAKPNVVGSTVVGWDEVPWGQAVVRIMTMTGWAIGNRQAEAPPPAAGESPPLLRLGL